jgi:hypothetical protein
MQRVLAALLAALLTACGAGGDALLAAVGSGGTGGGTPITALGSIRGFGSVIVNGVRFDDSAAAVSDDDGASLTSGQLRLGMVVLLEGRSDAATLTGVADSVQVITAVRGPVQSVGADSFVALGVPVSVVATTVFDGLAGLSELAPGQQVEVNGYLDPATGRASATRVARLSSVPSSFKARGLVGAVDAGSHTLQLGSLVVDYASAVLVGLPAGPQRGAVVKLNAARPPGADGIWRVDRVELVQAPALQESSNASLEGKVSGFQSIASFTVQGVRVDATRARFSGGSAASLADGMRVEVEGGVVGGVLEATEVEIEDEESHAQELEVEGSISAVTGPLRFVVRNTPIDASQARLDNGTAASVQVGRRVHVKGTSVGGVLLAERVEFEDAD